jgi:hypothetical protein
MKTFKKFTDELKVKDKKTGEVYSPSEKIDQLYKSKSFIDMMKRMKNEKGVGWPKSQNESVELTEATMTASGAEAVRHIKKYVTPHLSSSSPTHTLMADHGKMASGSQVKISKLHTINVRGKDTYHVHASDDHGNTEIVPINHLAKPGTKTENKGHQFENHFIDHLKKHGLMDKDATGAGSTAGTDFHVNNKLTGKKHPGKVQSFNGETKQDHTAAMGQLTIQHHPDKGWHIPEKARALRPKYAAEIEKAGILDHMNKHHPDPNKAESTASGRAKSIVMKHPNMNPGDAYLHDHHVDLLHVGGGKGTYAVGKDKTGHGFPKVSGTGKWTIREKQAGNKTSRTVMFQPDGVHGLKPSHVNLENEDHMKEFKKTLGH